jgi:hypothetical protein
MASLLDYILAMTGAQPAQANSAETQYIDPAKQEYADISSLPIYDPDATQNGTPPPSNTLAAPAMSAAGGGSGSAGASQAASMIASKKGADAGTAKTGASSQAGSSGMSKGQMALIIGQMVGDSMKQAGTQGTVAIPQASPPPQVHFQFPQIAYQGGR